MADQKQPTNSVASAESLLHELKQRAEQAHKNNDAFAFKLMTELIRVTSPIVTKAIARYHREERARINKLGDELKGQSRPTSPRNSEA